MSTFQLLGQTHPHVPHIVPKKYCEENSSSVTGLDFSPSAEVDSQPSRLGVAQRLKR